MRISDWSSDVCSSDLASSRKELIEKLAAALKERQEEFALMETADAGALINKSRTDVALCVSQLKYFAKMAENYNGQLEPVAGMQKEGRSYTYTSREPIGVCAQIIDRKSTRLNSSH